MKNNRENVFNLMEASNETYHGLMAMPYKVYKEFLEFKNELEKDKMAKNKEILERQKNEQQIAKTKIASANTANRLKNNARRQ